LEGVPISTSTLGIVYAAIAPARRSLAGEFTLLNAKTPHEQLPDMVVLAGVGVTTTLSNSLARDWAAITFHQHREWCAANRRPNVIPGGSPSNPMGAAAMTLSGGGEYAIHGTNDPRSIGGFVSYGCIRMYNEDVLDLYNRVSWGTTVVVTRWSVTRWGYQPRRRPKALELDLASLALVRADEVIE
jgi:L,D-transpeptidase catalytic domain